MPKLAYLLYRNPARSYEEFVRHYRAVHSPLAVEAMPLTDDSARFIDQSVNVSDCTIGKLKNAAPIDVDRPIRTTRCHS